jgi:hypothetical protein
MELIGLPNDSYAYVSCGKLDAHYKTLGFVANPVSRREWNLDRNRSVRS